MDLSIFLGKNLIVIFFFFCLGIFITSEMTELQKMIILYLCAYTVCFFKVLPVVAICVSVIAMQFIYTEYLSEDKMKMKVITNIKFKLIDFVFLFFTSYGTWIFCLSIVLQSNLAKKYLGHYFIACQVVSILMLILLIQYTGAKKFVIYSYSELMKSFETYPPKDFPRDIDEDKLNILAEVEDKSYFIRQSSYNLFSKEFFDYKFQKSNWKIFLKLGLKQKWKIIQKYMERTKNIRGYSTIEMQLMRSIGLEHGYTHVLERKIFEVFYTWSFVPSLKQYYEEHYALGRVNFKKYLVWVYYNTVPVAFKGIKYSKFSDVFGCDIENWTKEQVFVAVLALSGKTITEWTLDLYEDIIIQHDMNTETLKELVSRDVFYSLNKFEASLERLDGQSWYNHDVDEIISILRRKSESKWQLIYSLNEDENAINMIITTEEKMLLPANISEYLKRALKEFTKCEVKYGFG